MFTDSEHLLKTSKGAAPVQIASATPIAGGEMASVLIGSDLPDAEVEIDGGFIGNTPSTAKLTPGVHKITVRSGANIWSRDLNVQPGATVNVKATLKK